MASKAFNSYKQAQKNKARAQRTAPAKKVNQEKVSVSQTVAAKALKMKNMASHKCKVNDFIKGTDEKTPAETLHHLASAVEVSAPVSEKPCADPKDDTFIGTTSSGVMCSVTKSSPEDMRFSYEPHSYNALESDEDNDMHNGYISIDELFSPDTATKTYIVYLPGAAQSILIPAAVDSASIGRWTTTASEHLRVQTTASVQDPAIISSKVKENIKPHVADPAIIFSKVKTSTATIEVGGVSNPHNTAQDAFLEEVSQKLKAIVGLITASSSAPIARSSTPSTLPGLGRSRTSSLSAEAPALTPLTSQFFTPPTKIHKYFAPYNTAENCSGDNIQPSFENNGYYEQGCWVPLYAPGPTFQPQEHYMEYSPPHYQGYIEQQQ